MKSNYENFAHRKTDLAASLEDLEGLRSDLSENKYDSANPAKRDFQIKSLACLIGRAKFAAGEVLSEAEATELATREYQVLVLDV